MWQSEHNEFSIVGDMETRRGVYANAVFITSQKSEDIVDFIFTDGGDTDGGVTGVLSSRVIMTRETLLQFRSAIDQHLESCSNE